MMVFIFSGINYYASMHAMLNEFITFNKGHKRQFKGVLKPDII